MGKGGCEGEVTHRQRMASSLRFSTGPPKYRLCDVAKHKQPGDCWIIVKNKVYDVSNFALQHPGGKVIYTYAGKDATDVFSVFHATTTWNVLPQYHIGEYVQDEPTPELLSDFRELRATMMKLKLFDSNKLFYAYKFFSTLSILLVSWAMVALNNSWAAVIFSSALLALFYQQCGWLAHDFLHHQVFKTRSLNHAVGGVVLGNIAQGFSSSWWTSKHNTHHAAPNECDEKYRAIDPDIDTIPILAWSREMLDTVESKSVRAFLRWQEQLFVPILLLARFAWLHASWLHVLYSPMPRQQRSSELIQLVVHYVWVIGIAFSCLPIVKAVAWCLLGEVFAGAFLGIVFVQSHNGMEIYNDTKDFYSSQIVSTRDIKSTVFNDWFTGGLNRQIEHHLFPTLPRHNLHWCAERVKALCKQHDLVYEDVGMATGTKLVLQRLAEVAAAA